MSGTRQQLLNEDEFEQEIDIENDIKIQTSDRKKLLEDSLATLRTLRKKRRDAVRTMRETVSAASQEEELGLNSIGSGNVRQEESGHCEELPVSHQSTSEQQASISSENEETKQLVASDVHSASLEENSSSTSPNSDAIVSESMSLLDESATHIFGLMKGLHANQPPANVRSYDPERVNSAVNCANTLYKMMRLKLDAIKVQRKLVK